MPSVDLRTVVLCHHSRRVAGSQTTATDVTPTGGAAELAKRPMPYSAETVLYPATASVLTGSNVGHSDPAATRRLCWALALEHPHGHNRRRARLRRRAAPLAWPQPRTLRETR